MYSFLNNSNKAFILDLDPEKRIHSPELYVMWNLKIYLTHRVANIENTYSSKFFIYTDAGAFRKEALLNWPDSKIVSQVHNQIKDRALMGLINGLSYKPGTINDYIEGGFFGGSKTAIENLFNNFYDIHDERFEKGLFVGKDQTIMNILAFERHKSSVSLLDAYKYSNNCKCFGGSIFNCNYDKWFFFIPYFHSKVSCEYDKIKMILK